MVAWIKVVGQGLSGGVRRETEVEVLGPHHRQVVRVKEAIEADTGHRLRKPKEKEQGLGEKQ